MWFFKAHQGRKECFFNILDRKEYFSDQIREVLIMSAKLNFSKGLVHLFVKKSSFLPCGLFRKTNAEKIVF